MKKLGLVLLAFIVAVWFGACGDSKDSQAKSSDNLGESQTINTSDSQSESHESSATSDESQILDSQDLRTDSLNDSDLALLDEMFWDRVFYDFWADEKCLAKEIVTNKKERLFITKGAMESPVYHLRSASKSEDKYIFATDDDETTLEVLIKNDSIDMNFVRMSGDNKVYSMESKSLFELPSGVANGKQNGITTKANVKNHKICIEKVRDDEGNEWIIKDIEEILQEYLR